MAVITEIDHDNLIRISRLVGKIDYKELIASLKELYSDPGFAELPYSIWDLNEADLSSITADQVSSLVSFVKDNWGIEGNKKSAFVAGQDLAFGLARMYEQPLSLNTPSAVQIFHTMDEAMEWLLE